MDLFRGELTPEIRRELRERIEANANVDSDFVLPVLDVNVDHDTPYLVSEYCSGGNLRGLMDRQALAPKVALKLFHQACLALKAAHDNGLIHGDLKPENLLLDKHLNVKIADFGLAGDVSQRDGHFVKRRYIDKASYGEERRRKDSPTTYAEKFRFSFQRPASVGIEVDEKLQSYILIRMMGLSEVMHQSVLSVSQGEIKIGKLKRLI